MSIDREIERALQEGNYIKDEKKLRYDDMIKSINTLFPNELKTRGFNLASIEDKARFIREGECFQCKIRK